MEKTKNEEEAIEMERNWADLPPELFPLILEKLPEICDFVRCRAVCKSWNLSSSVSDLPPQFPWIFIRSRVGPDLEFYSIAFNKVYTIRCSSGKRLLGPAAGGYLLTGQVGNADSFSLLNPLNNREVPLPLLPDCDPYMFPFNFHWFNSPSFQIGDYLLYYESEISVRCRPGANRWDIIGPGREFQYRCFYLNGLLFRVEGATGVTKIMDISTHKELYVIPPPVNLSQVCFGGPYLVDSCGEILAVYYDQSYKWTDCKLYIHRLEFGNGKGKPCWVKLSSIGDRILFLETPLYYGCGLCLKASDFAGFKENCIYFIGNVVYMYDIENGETISIDTPFNNRGRIIWFMPTLNHI